MKTGNVSQDAMFIKQTKPIRENKATDKRDLNKVIEEKVDISTKSSLLMSSPIVSNEEALELLNGIDYQQTRSVQWVSDNGAAKLMELMLA